MKAIISICLCLISLQNLAQNGLEKIIVEKYYISDSKEAESLGGKLPVGSVTYRVFVDLLPLYRFQAVYGIPGHEMRLSTSTRFYNNEDKGAAISTVIPDRNLGNNTVMLDSWLSVGASSEGTVGVLKSDDKDVKAIQNFDGLLQNENPLTGISLKKSDGMVSGTPPRVTAFGIDSALALFNNKTIGSSFSTTNGSWASLRGSVGIDSTGSNRVLIGQFTTDGIFSFELNIQIGTPYGSTQNYVARNPVDFEILMPELIFTSAAADKTSKNKGASKHQKK